MSESGPLSFGASPSTAAVLDDAHPDKPRRRMVARNLFGACDSQATTAWLRDRLNELQQEQNERWNFDFANELPLGAAGRYQFTPVAESDVPAFYRSKTIPARRRRSSAAAEENEAPLTALLDYPSASAASSASSSVASPQPTPDGLVADSLELEPARVSATPAVKRQKKITDHLPVRKRRASQRLPK